MIRPLAALVCTILAGCAPQSAMSADASFCTAWDKVYETANRGFAPWRGAHDKVLDQFTSTVNFPKADHCWIEEDENTFEFICDWKYALSETDHAIEDAKALGAGIRDCLHSRKARNRYLDDLSELSKPNIVWLWRDTIPDEDDTAKSTNLSVVRRAETKLKSGRVVTPSLVVVALRARYVRY